MVGRRAMMADVDHSVAPSREPTGPPVRVVHLMWRLSKGGGIPVVVRNLIERIDPARAEFRVITIRPRFEEDELGPLPARVDGLGFTGTLSVAARLQAVVKAGVATFRARPQVVHVHSGTAWMSVLARLLLPRTPFLLEVHDAPGHGRHSARTERFEGLLARRFGYRAVCHSPSVQADLERDWRLSAHQIVRFPLGIDTEQFSRPSQTRDAWRTAHAIALDRPLVLCVARLVPSKNVALLIEAASRLVHPVTIAVIAGGSQHEALEADIVGRGLQDRIRLLGTVSLSELVDAYHSADVFCSTSDYEGFGLAVVEAMAAGLPVVTTAVGGVIDLVMDGVTGRLVPAGDAAALAQGLAEILIDEGTRIAMGRSGRARAVVQFDVAQMVAAFDDLYRATAIGGSARSGRAKRAVGP